MPAIPRSGQQVLVAGCTVLALLLPAPAQAQFTSPPTYAAGVIAEPSNAVFTAVGDLNGDGKPDLAAVDAAAQQVVVRINTTSPGGAPSFHSGNLAVPIVHPIPRRVALGDLNGDGKPDLVVTGQFSIGTTGFEVYMNTTTPGALIASFDTVNRAYVAGLENPLDVVIADFNGDGVADLAIADSGSSSQVIVVKGTTLPGSGTFAPGSVQSLTVGTTPRSLAVGDFNGDGRLDLAVANQGSQNVSLLRNDPDTSGDPNDPGFSFQAPVNVSLPGTNPSTIVTGDFNGDGKLDLAVSGGTSSANVFLLRNQTTLGTNPLSFAAAGTFATESSPTGMAVGDLNGDGKPDLVAGNLLSGTISTLINTTSSGASSMTMAAKVDSAVGPRPFSVAVRDMNGDGRPDVIVGDNTNKNIQVLRNTTTAPVGGAAFGPKADFAALARPRSVAVVDFNGDGKPDLAVANSDSSQVSVLLNTTVAGAALPTFASKTDFVTLNGPRSVVVGDFNGDGKPDLAVANFSSDQVSVLVNTTPAGAGAPAFATKVDLATLVGPASVTVGDFNGDGKPDLAVANSGSGQVSVLLNTTPAGASAPTFAAKVDLATLLGPASVAVADFNGDGKPDLAVANDLSNTLSVLLNTTGAGASLPTFADKVDFATPSGPVSVAVGDFNGDGKPDLTVANNVAFQVSVLLNTTPAGAPAPTFAERADFATPSFPAAVAVEDFNGDGSPDLAVATGLSNLVRVLLNTTPTGASAPTFVTKADLATVTGLSSVAVGDFNRDGKQDLALAREFSNQASILLNTPYGAARIDAAPSTRNEASAGGFVTVARDGSTSNGPVSVTLAASGGTATNVTDYVFQTSVLDWVQGDITSKATLLSLVNDSVPEGDETIVFSLSNPTTGLGLVGDQTVTIIDDECAGKNIGVAVTSGGAGVLNVSLTGRSPALITSVLFKGGGTGNIPVTNATYTLSGQGPRTGDFTLTPASPVASVQFSLTRSSGSGTATLPFDVTDQCGTQSKFVGGGANAWGGGSGPESPPQGGPAPAMRIPTTPPVPGAACATFPTHAAAQAHLRKDPTDPLILDRNRNGIACEGADGAGFVNPPLDQVPVPRP